MVPEDLAPSGSAMERAFMEELQIGSDRLENGA
jgi:hypothetical protein